MFSGDCGRAADITAVKRRHNFSPQAKNITEIRRLAAVFQKGSSLMKVAIDGPAGAGKSAVARAAAKDLGFIYVDTGALYRTIGLFALRQGVDPHSGGGVIPLLKNITEELRFIDGEQRVFLNGEDVSDLIRTEEVSAAASAVSAIPQVRAFLYHTQRDIAEKNSVIMDGRDIGTAILPDAEVKIFLTAAPEARAARRVNQLREKGISAGFDEVLAEINERDRRDSSRAAAPLAKAEDAVLMDNTNMTLAESIDAVKRLVTEAKCR